MALNSIHFSFPALLNLMLTVSTYFVVYYPYLACLVSEHHLVASVLGFGYVAFRYALLHVNIEKSICWTFSFSEMVDVPL